MFPVTIEIHSFVSKVNYTSWNVWFISFLCTYFYKYQTMGKCFLKAFPELVWLSQYSRTKDLCEEIKHGTTNSVLFSLPSTSSNILYSKYKYHKLPSKIPMWAQEVNTSVSECLPIYAPTLQCFVKWRLTAWK